MHHSAKCRTKRARVELEEEMEVGHTRKGVHRYRKKETEKKIRER